MDVSISVERAPSEVVEVAEHKGVGHPDSICDALAEASSIALSRAYLERFDRVLHHNVDKALLVGGASAPRFGGGEVIAPMEIDVAGRVTSAVGDRRIDADEIVRAACDRWLRGAMHALDVDRHVVLRPRLRAGSVDLRALFDRGAESAKANDTSCTAAYAPASLLDRVVLCVADALKDAAASKATPWAGEDVKVMGVRRGARVELTVACAIVDRFTPDAERYREAMLTIEALARARAAEIVASSRERIDALDVFVNAADDRSKGVFYLTVTGTSAESGDDGEVGRGNRVNRLITPGRAMTLEATAGKNAVTHVGKIHSVAARALAERIATIEGIESAEVLIVSRIGARINEPRFAHVRLRTADGRLDERGRRAVEEEVRAAMASLPALCARLVRGEIAVF